MFWLTIVLLAAIWAWALGPPGWRAWRAERAERPPVPQHRNVVTYAHHRRPRPVDAEANGWLDWR